MKRNSVGIFLETVWFLVVITNITWNILFSRNHSVYLYSVRNYFIQNNSLFFTWETNMFWSSVNALWPRPYSMTIFSIWILNQCQTFQRCLSIDNEKIRLSLFSVKFRYVFETQERPLAIVNKMNMSRYEATTKQCFKIKICYRKSIV